MADSVGSVGATSSGGNANQPKRAEMEQKKQAFIQQEVARGIPQDQAEKDWEAQHPHHKKSQSATNSSTAPGQMDTSSPTTPPSGSVFS